MQHEIKLEHKVRYSNYNNLFVVRQTMMAGISILYFTLLPGVGCDPGLLLALFTNFPFNFYRLLSFCPYHNYKVNFSQLRVNEFSQVSCTQLVQICNQNILNPFMTPDMKCFLELSSLVEVNHLRLECAPNVRAGARVNCSLVKTIGQRIQLLGRLDGARNQGTLQPTKYITKNRRRLVSKGNTIAFQKGQKITKKLVYHQGITSVYLPLDTQVLPNYQDS